MCKQILFILSTLVLLIYPLSLSAQNSIAGDHVLTPDFDGDGQVGFPDFLAFISQFGGREGDGRYDAKYDLNRDGEIGFFDFLIFSSGDESENIDSFRQWYHGHYAFIGFDQSDKSIS